MICILIVVGHIKAKHGDTPYHPGKEKKPRVIAHPAKTAPGRNSIAGRRRPAAGHVLGALKLTPSFLLVRAEDRGVVHRKYANGVCFR